MTELTQFYLLFHAIEADTKIKFNISKTADIFPFPQFPDKLISFVLVCFWNLCSNLFLGNKSITRIIEAQLDLGLLPESCTCVFISIIVSPPKYKIGILNQLKGGKRYFVKLDLPYVLVIFSSRIT